jgi:hypothetical protein
MREDKPKYENGAMPKLKPNPLNDKKKNKRMQGFFFASNTHPIMMMSWSGGFGSCRTQITLQVRLLQRLQERQQELSPTNAFKGN